MIEQSVEEVVEAISSDPRYWAELILELQKSNRELISILQKYAAKTATPAGNGGH